MLHLSYPRYAPADLLLTIILYCFLCIFILRVLFWKSAQNFIFHFSSYSIFFCAFSNIWRGLLMILRDDIEANPGPRNNYNECLSTCRWNLNSISVYGCSKLFLLKTYNSVPKFDIFYLSEAYLDSTVPIDDVIW